MINLLVSLLILAIVAGLLWWAITMLPLPAPFAQIVRVVFVLIIVLVLLGVLFGNVQVPVLRL